MEAVPSGPLAVAIALALMVIAAAMSWLVVRSRWRARTLIAESEAAGWKRRAEQAEQEAANWRSTAQERSLDARQEEGWAAHLTSALARVERQVTTLEKERATQFGEVGERLLEVARTTRRLDDSTTALAGSLRSSSVRGTWGETQLRRLVELAGLLPRVDFGEQVASVSHHDAAVRPDLVVHLPGDRMVVVDAKAPLSAFLEAQESTEDVERRPALAAHAAAVRGHVQSLSAKAYWSAFETSPQFVVCFVPTDAMLATALQHDPELYDWALSRDVVFASPATTMALLRTVAVTWQQEQVTQNASAVLALGRELHHRLGTAASHLSGMGRQLTRTVESYNALVGGLESRVMVSARKFNDLGLSGASIEQNSVVDVSPRPLTAHEFLTEPEPTPRVSDSDSSAA